MTLGATLAAYALRRLGVRHWWVYVLGPGVASWVGLVNAHLHPALALVFVVPFLPTDSCAESALHRCCGRVRDGGGKVWPTLGTSTHGPRHANNDVMAGGEGRDAHEGHAAAHEEFHRSPLHKFHQHTARQTFAAGAHYVYP